MKCDPQMTSEERAEAARRARRVVIMRNSSNNKVLFKKPDIWPKWLNKHWAEALEKYAGKTITIGKAHPWNWTNPWNIPNIEGREISYLNKYQSRSEQNEVPANLLFAPILDEQVCDAVIGYTYWCVCLDWCEPVAEESLEQALVSTGLDKDIKHPAMFQEYVQGYASGEPDMAIYYDSNLGVRRVDHENNSHSTIQFLQEQLTILRNERNSLQERVEQLRIDLVNSENSAKSAHSDALSLGKQLDEAKGQLNLADGRIEMLEKTVKAHNANIAPPQSLLDRCYSRFKVEGFVACQILSDMGWVMLMPATYLGRNLKIGFQKLYSASYTGGALVSNNIYAGLVKTKNNIQKFRRWFDVDCPVQHPNFANAVVLTLLLSYLSPVVSLGYVGIYEVWNHLTEQANAAMVIPPAATLEGDRRKMMREHQQQVLMMLDSVYQTQALLAQTHAEEVRKQQANAASDQYLAEIMRNSPAKVVEAYVKRKNEQQAPKPTQNKRFY